MDIVELYIAPALPPMPPMFPSHVPIPFGSLCVETAYYYRVVLYDHLGLDIPALHIR